MSKKYDSASRQSSISVSRSEADEVQTSERKYKNMARVLKERLAESESKLKKYMIENDLLSQKLEELNYAKDDEDNKDEKENIKKLQANITLLQNKINKEASLHKKIVEELKEAHLKNISDLENNMTILKESSQKDKTIIENFSKNFGNEKEQLKLQLKKEKDEEIARINSEKIALENLLRQKQDNVEKKTRELEKLKDEETMKLKNELAIQKTEYEKKLLSTNDIIQREIDNVKTLQKGEITEMIRLHKKDIEKISSDYEKKIAVCKSDSGKQAENLNVFYKTKTENLQKTIADLTNELSSTKLKIDTRLEECKAECKKIMDKKDVEHKSTLDTKESLLTEIKLKTDKRVGELEDTLIVLQNQLAQARENIKRMNESSVNIQAQHTATLARQKESNDKVLYEKEEIIVKLERNLKKLAEESVDRFNLLERKLLLNREEIKDITEKYNNTKALLEKSEFNNTCLKNDIAKFKDLAEKNMDKSKQEYTEKEACLKKLSIVEADVKSKDQEIIRTRGELSRLLQNENIVRDDKVKIGKELNMLREDNVLKKKDIEGLNLTITNLREEMLKLRNRFPEELKIKVETLTIEKDKVINDLTNKISTLENMIKSSQTAKDRYESTISNMNTEKEKAKASFDFLKLDYERKLGELAETTKRITNLESQFLTNMREISTREQELVILRQKVKEIESKDTQIVNLNTQLGSIRQTYTHTLNRLTEDHKKEREELMVLRKKVGENALQISELSNAKANVASTQENCRTTIIRNDEMHAKEMKKVMDKVKDLEMKAIYYGQNIEQLKLDHLKEMNKARQLPPEDQEKLLEYEKQCKELKTKLELTEARLEKTQLDYAGTQATIKTKEEFLREKEIELRKYETSLRNEPPKLLDPMFKTGRDEALSKLRQKNIEYNKLAEEMKNMQEKVRDMQRERDEVKISYERLKTEFIEKLNSREQRIRELETVK